MIKHRTLEAVFGISLGEFDQRAETLTVGVDDDFEGVQPVSPGYGASHTVASRIFVSFDLGQSVPNSNVFIEAMRTGTASL